MELKTLKDLEQTPSDFGGIYSLEAVREDAILDKDNVVVIGDLRAEAIKWINDINKDFEESEILKEITTRYYPDAEDFTKLLMKFFNITEEDLK